MKGTKATMVVGEAANNMGRLIITDMGRSQSESVPGASISRDLKCSSEVYEVRKIVAKAFMLGNEMNGSNTMPILPLRAKWKMPSSARLVPRRPIPGVHRIRHAQRPYPNRLCHRARRGNGSDSRQRVLPCTRSL